MGTGLGTRDRWTSLTEIDLSPQRFTSALFELWVPQGFESKQGLRVGQQVKLLARVEVALAGDDLIWIEGL